MNKIFKRTFSNRNIALMFPGQGYQNVGMLNDLLFDFQSEIKSFDDVLFPLTKLNISDLMTFNKQTTELELKEKSKQLQLTEISQPAILLHSYLNYQKFIKEVFNKNEMQLKYLFGPSLGEIIALCISGSLPLSETGKLLYFRGKFMQESCKKGEGSMLNIIGDQTKTILLFEKFKSEVIKNESEREFINISSNHSKRLIVVSGKKELIDQCANYFKSQNISTRGLNVSAAFHSKLMEKGKVNFEEYLRKVELKQPEITILSTVTGDTIDIDENFELKCKDILVGQFIKEIKLFQTLQKLKNENIEIYDIVKRKFVDYNEYI